MPDPSHPTVSVAGPAGIPVTMSRPHLRDIPDFAFPAGFDIRPMRPNEGGLWEDIWRDAEPHFSIEPALFEKEFGSDAAEIGGRCYLITGPRGVAVGTLSAWHSRDSRGDTWGRIHWVAVRPAFQGKGLAKAGLGYALHRLAQWHDRAWLATQTARVGAIKLYLEFGFAPDLEPAGAREAWGELGAKLRYPVLKER